ncbi:hypothetical protein N665_1230s0001 [Sinapis alba]|nr:hypothetical protein N665_1230s0001 [Sinapis alba]
MPVDDHDIQKLVIVTQNSGRSDGTAREEPLEKHPELEKLLKEEYRSVGDFRAKDPITSQKENQSH